MKQTCTTLFFAIRNVTAECITWGPALAREVLNGIFESMSFLALYCISLPGQLWPVRTHSSTGTSNMYSYTPGVSQDLLGLEQLNTISQNGYDPKLAETPSSSRNIFQSPNILIGTKDGRLMSLTTSTKVNGAKESLHQDVLQGSSTIPKDLIDLSSGPAETASSNQSFPAYVDELSSNLSVSSEVNCASDRDDTNNTENDMNNMVQRCLVELASTTNLKKEL